MGRRAGAWTFAGYGTPPCPGACVAALKVSVRRSCGTVQVRQRGCSFRFTSPNDVSGATVRGTIRGRRIRLRKPAQPNIPGIDIKKLDFRGSGRIAASRDRATIRISARIEGESRGVDVTCTVRETARLARVATAAGIGSRLRSRPIAGGSTVLSLMDAGSLAIMAARAGLSDADWRIAGWGDLDGDGRADIVRRHLGTGEHQVWLSDPAEPTPVGLDREPDPDWHVAAIADLDDDGRADLVWRNEKDGAGEAWLMYGAVARERMSLSALDSRSRTVP